MKIKNYKTFFIFHLREATYWGSHPSQESVDQIQGIQGFHLVPGFQIANDEL